MREAGTRAARHAAPSGGGSTPRRNAASRQETGVPGASRPEAESAAPRPRILVVDDEPAVRRFVVEALRSSGYDPVGAGSGREALSALYAESQTPTLLLTDIEMPGMTGIELAARVRADRPGIRVVLMTGRETSAARARERAGLVEGVLLKPFGLAELLDAVIDALAVLPGES
jgi:two-component system cell cycle sensor histidine kinase/response regulator CckA